MQHDHRRRRSQRPGQGQHLVQEGPQEDLRSGQLQDGRRTGGVSREVDGLDHREAVGGLRLAAPAPLQVDHSPGAPPNAKGGLQRRP